MDKIVLDSFMEMFMAICEQISNDINNGLSDEDGTVVPILSTKKYAEYIKNHTDVTVLQPALTSTHASGPGKFAVQTILSISATLVEKLIEAGVPPEVAFPLLPHEIYVELVGQEEPKKL